MTGASRDSAANLLEALGDARNGSSSRRFFLTRRKRNYGSRFEQRIDLGRAESKPAPS